MKRYLISISPVDAAGIIDRVLFGSHKYETQANKVAEACRIPPFNWFVDSIQPTDYIISEVSSLDLI